MIAVTKEIAAREIRALKELDPQALFLIAPLDNGPYARILRYSAVRELLRRASNQDRGSDEAVRFLGMILDFGVQTDINGMDDASLRRRMMMANQKANRPEAATLKS